MTENTARPRLRRATSGDAPVRYNREQVYYSMLAYFAKLRQIEEEQQSSAPMEPDSPAFEFANEDSTYYTGKTQAHMLRRKRAAALAPYQETYLQELKRQTERCTDLFETLPFGYYRLQSCGQNARFSIAASEDDANPNYDVGKVLLVKRRRVWHQFAGAASAKGSTELQLSDVISQLAVQHYRTLGKRTSVLRCAASYVIQHRYIPLEELEAQKRLAKQNTTYNGYLFGYVDVNLCANQALVHVKDGQPRALLTLGLDKHGIEGQRFASIDSFFSCECDSFGFLQWEAATNAAQTQTTSGDSAYCDAVLLDHTNGVYLAQAGLRTLILANIDFEGELDAEECCLDVCIDGLYNLVIFNCIFRRLLLTAPELRNLHVSVTSERAKCCTVELVGPDFGLHCTQLRTASFVGCDVSCINFSQANSLRSLSFHAARRVPRLDSAIVASGLQSLDCSASSLRLQPHLAFCAQLLRITLSGSRISAIDCCNLPPCLYDLYCSGTGLRQFSNAHVLKALASLQLSHNKLQRIERFPFGLKVVDLAESGISSLNGLENHAELEVLDVSQICQVETDFWFLSENLRELRAQNCTIGILPDLRHFEHLRTLLLDGNKGIQINQITLPDSLKILSLSGCELRELFDMGRFARVEMLDLSCNAGIKLHCDHLPRHVGCLKLFGCQLTDLYLRSVTVDEICLEGNYLSFFYTCCGKCRVVSDELVATPWGIFVRAHQRNARLAVAKKLLDVYSRYRELAWLYTRIGAKL